jgi:hypothetical protein
MNDIAAYSRTDSYKPAQPPANGEPTTDGFELKWHGETDDSPLKEWLVDKTLPKVGKALIAGQWGTYKTFIALDLSASVMTKRYFAGRRVDRQGGVLFVAAEGQDEVRVRLKGLAVDKSRRSPTRKGRSTSIPPECRLSGSRNVRS